MIPLRLFSNLFGHIATIHSFSGVFNAEHILFELFLVVLKSDFSWVLKKAGDNFAFSDSYQKDIPKFSRF
jgi:hypothetical protein